MIERALGLKPKKVSKFNCIYMYMYMYIIHIHVRCTSILYMYMYFPLDFKGATGDDNIEFENEDEKLEWEEEQKVS